MIEDLATDWRAAMLRILLTISALLAACTPSPREASMPSASSGPASPVSTAVRLSAGSEPSAAAEGRRILSTAFVRIGPDGYLTVELRDGSTLVLRNVTMGAADYCGARVVGPTGGTKFCGGYAEVAAARPGAAPPLPPTGSTTADVREPRPPAPKGN